MRGESIRLRRLGAVVIMAVLCASVAVLARAEAAGPPVIEVLSNRADLISGGDALVAVRLPRGTSPSSARMDVDGKDVTRAFAVRPNGKLEGFLKGLRNGRNALSVHLPSGPGARIDIVSHPIGGPVFAGPQIKPWTCAAGARDKQCNRAARYEWLYMSTNGGQLQAYDPKNPPDDVANTTTDNGATVPYIVRQEIGAIDRDEYRIAVLYDPSKPWAPWAPQKGFNHKLVITHGASCDTSYAQGTAPDVLNTTALSRGFVVMSHALDNAGHNCNIVTQAESLVMTKEYLIERYGELRYTIGSGCSGGSLVQQQVANAYPGLYQGISPQCSFPDAWSSGMQYEDFFLLRDYFEQPNRWERSVAWTPADMGAVEGHPNFLNAVTFTEAIPDSGNPDRPCPGLEDSQVYDPQTNPNGVRCSLTDYMVNVYGRRKKDGFAQVAWDNVGVQYGLLPLMAGKITPAQFVDLNEKIGGWDIDKIAVPQRVSADRFALDAAYRSGAINVANNLDKVAIIDLRGPDPGAFHDVYRTYAVRSRLFREHGDADNQLIWRGFVPLLGDSSFVNESILALDKWLTNIERDRSRLPLAEKIVKVKPKDVVERCTNGGGADIPKAACDAVVESYSTPRIQAGMPFTDDVMKCALKPLRPSDYYPIKFTDDQWSKLRKTFPSGTCDYSKRGIGKQATVAWQTYQDAAGRVIYGGRPLGAPPRSRAVR